MRLPGSGSSGPAAHDDLWWVVRIGLAAGSAVGACASYQHALSVVIVADGRHPVAYFIPALADLLVMSSAANILDALRHGSGWKRIPWLSVASIAVALAVTIGMNKAATHPASFPAWLVNVWPPVSFALFLEAFLGHARRTRARAAQAEQDAAGPSLQAAAAGARTPREQLDAWLRELCDGESQNKVADLVGVSRPRVAAAILPPAATSLNGDAPHD